jgi:hypothetical protein
MSQNRVYIAHKIISRKLAFIAVILFSAVASFATLGDGKKKTGKNKSLLSANKTVVYKPGSFSLRSGYTYRGTQVLNTPSDKRVIRINTTVTIQKGRTSFIVPLKKNVVVSKIKLDFSNRQFNRP